jgi:hypothetical protein
MNTIKVKDFDSMQAITVSLARNGYLVTADSVTDENYKDHWEIKYCEFSEMNKIPVNNGSDWDGDRISSMEIHNKDNTKGVKCEVLPDEKPLEENDNDPPFKPIQFDEKGMIIKNNKKEIHNDYGLVPRNKVPDIPVIPNQDVSDNITDDQMTIITSVSGN